MIEISKKALQSAKLDIFDACASIIAENLELESFIHSQKYIGMIRVNHSAVRFTIDNPAYGIKGNLFPLKRPGAITQSLKNLKYEKPMVSLKISENEEMHYFTQKINENMTYGMFLSVTRHENKTEAVYTVSIGSDAEDAIKKAEIVLRNANELGYDACFCEHRKWWESFWNESSLELPDQYMERKWYMTNYLLGACSRQGHPPMPLQGVWTADNGQLPPWKGDYHFDLNAQLSYQSYLKANHMESGKSYIDFLIDHEKNAENFAQNFYGAKGLCLPSVMDIAANPLGGWAMYSLSPTNQAWLCHGIKEYCDYSADRRFTAECAYPYMKKYGEFLLSLLEKDSFGQLKLPISSSPETHDNTVKAWMTPNSNYDNALIITHFRSLTQMAESLNLSDEADRWKSVLSELPPLAIDEDHTLMLSPNEKQKRSHRHFSHLMAIYPLKLFPYTPEYRRVIDSSVEQLEELGSSEYCGYSFAWLANLYAVQKRGEMARNTLHTFWEDFCLENVFHINGDYKKTGKSTITYRLFTLEGNFCAAEALQNMLLQCDAESIELFPAIPQTWENVSFKMLAHGGVTVSCTMFGKRIERLELTAKTRTTLKVSYNDRQKEVCLLAGEPVVLSDI